MTIRYYLTYTGIPVNFGITVLLGFIVGVAIAGQTFYLFTVENLKQFGALKAMGVSNMRLVGMVLFQALVVAVLGYSLGIGLAALFGTLTQGTEISFFMPWQIPVITAVAVVLIAALASVVSIRPVLVLEPAVVFR
jgi:putative ABC transport system permease protein